MACRQGESEIGVRGVEVKFRMVSSVKVRSVK